MINIFPGINGQQGNLEANLYNIHLSSFAYGSSLSGPQPYLTVNCTKLYNLCNTKLTLQSYGYASGGNYGATIILNGGNSGGSSISFTNDTTTTCTMYNTNTIFNGSLKIVETTGTPASSTNGSLIFEHNNSGGASSILFKSKFNQDSDYGYIQYQDASTVGGGGESSRLIIGTQNDYDDHILLLPSSSGGVGIGTDNPGGNKLYVNGSTYINGPLYSTYWRLTNESDYCRLYNRNDNNLFNFAANTLYVNGDLSYKGHRQPLIVRYYLISNGVNNSGHWVDYKGYSNVYFKIMILSRYGEYSYNNIPTNVPYEPVHVLNVANIEYYLFGFSAHDNGGQTKFWWGNMPANTKIYVEEMWY